MRGTAFPNFGSCFAVYLLCATASSAIGAVNIEQYGSGDFVFKAVASGNPFDVELRGDFSGSNGLRLTVPGFYDGGGAWKIRFSPPRQGNWTLRTSSSLPALDGQTREEIQCVANTNTKLHGGLRVDPAHPRHFVFEDGTRYFLMSCEADWLWAPDMRDPGRKVMHRLIDMMASRGFNQVIVDMYAHDTPWNPGKTCDWDYGPPDMFAWEGTNEKPDHSRLNPEFFQLYDGMMEALRERGIVAHILIKVYNKRVNWPPEGSRDEERYFRYVVARYQGFANVIWDFSKEGYFEKDKRLESRLLDLVRYTDAYHHLTTVHDDTGYEFDPELSRNLDFRTEQHHSDYADMVLFDRARRAYPVMNAEFGYEYGVEKLPTHHHPNQCDWQELTRRAYHIYLAGGYGNYYYNNIAWDVVKPDPEPPGMKAFQILKDSLSALPYWRMEPANDLAVGGPCLALPGEAYAFYVEGSNVIANLSALSAGPVTAEWINTWTGDREKVSTVTESINTWDGADKKITAIRPGVMKLKKPASFAKAPGLLIMRQER